MSNIDIDLYSCKSDITTSPDCIEIEITGLKSISKFIGLEDTPTYYENGKFFKVENNRIVYTDIEIGDLKGKFEDNPELYETISALIEKEAKEVAFQAVDKTIELHNLNEKAHPYIQKLIETTNIKVDENTDNISNLTQVVQDDYNELDIRIKENAKQIIEITPIWESIENLINEDNIGV